MMRTTRTTFRTALVALACTLGLTLGLTLVPSSAHAQHAGAPEHGPAPHDTKAPGDAHESGHESGHEGHGPKPMNIADFSNKETPPYVALLVNFGVLAFGYYALGKKPIVGALKQRKEDIGKEIEAAQKLLADAVSRGKASRKKLKNIDEAKKSARDTLVETGEGERDKLVREAEEKAARVGRDAGFLVDQEAKQLRLDLTRETVEKSVAKATELLKVTVTQADHERLAEEFLAELGTKALKAQPSSVTQAGGAGAA